MFLLRDQFISESCKPEGCFVIPATEHLSQAVQKARRALLRPEISSVVIKRNYQALSSMAERLTIKFNKSMAYELDDAPNAPDFMHEAGRDFLITLGGFKQDQKFAEIEINAKRKEYLSSHLDFIQPEAALDNIDKGFLGGAVVVVQSLALSGTGIFCSAQIGERLSFCEPVKDGGDQWFYEDGRAEAEGLEAAYAAPGDIVILRTANWGPYYPPSVHTAPVCNIRGLDRPAYIADGCAIPVLA